MRKEEFISEICRRYLMAFPNIEDIPIESVRDNYVRSNFNNINDKNTMELLRSILIGNDKNKGKVLFTIVKSVLQGAMISKEATSLGMKKPSFNQDNVIRILGGRSLKVYNHFREREGANTCFITAPGRDNKIGATLKETKTGLKMIAVAEGIGEGEKVQKAQEIALKEIESWLYGLPEGCFERIDMLLDKIDTYDEFGTSLAERISKAINEQLGKNAPGVSFACAIAGKNETLIANIGTPQIFLANSKGVGSIVNPDTVAYELYKSGEIDKNDIPFASSDTTKCIGEGWEIQSVNKKIIPNSSYSKLIISAGIDKFIDGKELTYICQKNFYATLLSLIREVGDKIKGTYKITKNGILNGDREAFGIAAVSNPQENAGKQGFSSTDFNGYEPKVEEVEESPYSSFLKDLKYMLFGDDKWPTLGELLRGPDDEHKPGDYNGPVELTPQNQQTFQKRGIKGLMEKILSGDKDK